MLIQIDIQSGIQILNSRTNNREQQVLENDDICLIIYGSLFDITKVHWIDVNELQNYKDLKSALQNFFEGAASIIICNKKENSIQVYTDPYRLFCLYIFRSLKKILISDSIVQLKNNISVTINETSILELACINNTIGNKTIYNEISTLPEGKIYSFSKNENAIQEDVESYWDYPTRQGEDISVNEIAEVFNSHVKKGLQLSDSISLALTAGLDSRATLAAALTGKEKLKLYTHGFAKSNDVKVASGIAKHFGITHNFYDLNSADFIQSIPELANVVNDGYEGSLNGLSHAHAVLSYTKQQQQAEVFFSSFGGELLRTYYLPQGLPSEISLDEMADGIRKISQVKVWIPVFNKNEKLVQEELNQSIYNELQLAPDKSSYVALADFYYHRRNFNSVTTRFAAKYFKIFNPYFSREIYKMLPDVPAHLKINGDIQKQIVKDGDIYLSKVLLNNQYAAGNSVYSKLLVKAARAEHISKVLINKITNRQLHTLYFTDYDTWIKNYHSEWFLNAFEMNNKTNAFNNMELVSFTKQYLEGHQPFAYYRFLTNIFSILSYVNNIKLEK
ncbi:MAG: hypothetical protein IPL48_11915 [Bacteroidetes bacterium]|nr:hypothetical protein [Bacteroidota bacterium]